MCTRMYVYAYAISTNIAGTAPEIIDKIVSPRAAYICEQLHEKANNMTCVDQSGYTPSLTRVSVVQAKGLEVFIYTLRE